MFVVDASYAAIRRDREFAMRDVPATVDLPCEESEYESGVSLPFQYRDSEHLGT